jgi:hypothetical protein
MVSPFGRGLYVLPQPHESHVGDEIIVGTNEGSLRLQRDADFYLMEHVTGELALIAGSDQAIGP